VAKTTAIDKSKLKQASAKLLNIGADLAEKGLLDEAIAIFEQGLVLNPKDAAIYTNLGHAYFDKGLIDEAIAHYRQALTLRPKLVDALERLGTAYMNKGLFSKAITYYERAKKLNPSDPVLLANIGKACLDKGLMELAILHLRQALKQNPRSANIHNTLGTAYAQKGLIDEAIAEFKQAIQLDSKNWLYHSNLADRYYEKEMWDESIEEYEQVLALDTGSAAIHNNLGAAYAQRGLLDKAVTEFKLGKKLDPHSKLILNNLKIVRRMKISLKKGDSLAVKRKTRGLKVIDETVWQVPIMKGQMDKAENTVEKWLQELKGDIIGELDFIDKTTFGYLDSIPKSCGIRIITSCIKDPDKCKVKAKKCSQDRPYFEIIVFPKIHQRWIGSKESFFIDIGTDLKTDALGHSTHTIRKLVPENYKKDVEQFEKLWTTPEEELRKTYGSSNLSKNLFFSTSCAG
jgi:tetratricopeptide (TPR) repeat protein